MDEKLQRIQEILNAKNQTSEQKIVDIRRVLDEIQNVQNDSKAGYCVLSDWTIYKQKHEFDVPENVVGIVIAQVKNQPNHYLGITCSDVRTNLDKVLGKLVRYGTSGKLGKVEIENGFFPQVKHLQLLRSLMLKKRSMNCSEKREERSYWAIDEYGEPSYACFDFKDGSVSREKETFVCNAELEFVFEEGVGTIPCDTPCDLQIVQ